MHLATGSLADAVLRTARNPAWIGELGFSLS